MKALLRLYPRAWRRRYGDEVAAMLEGRPFSLAVAIDLLAGAVDARLHPRQTLSAAAASMSPGQEEAMIKSSAFDCARMFGPAVTRSDQRKALVAMSAVMILLTGVWMWVHIRRGDNPIVDAFSIMPWITGMIVSLRYTYLKDRSAGTQAVVIGGLTFVSGALLFGAGLVATGL